MLSLHTRYGALVILSLAFGCTGTDETVTQQNPVDPSTLDDIAPAATAFDPSLTYDTRQLKGQNHSQDRFRFDIAAFANDTEKDAAAKLYPSHAALLAARKGDAIPSVQTVATYVKQLDDTIYAGVEHAVQVGLAPTIASKRTILTEAVQYLGEHRSQGADEALALVTAALRLGGATVAAPSDLEPNVAAVSQAFLADVATSKPYGFYTWSDELRGVWQQDRLLQRALSPAGACALAQAIAADPARAQRYGQLVSLYSRMTNPVRASLVDLLPAATDASCTQKGAGLAFLSASRSVEDSLFAALYPQGVPAGANLMQDLVDAIRKGTVDLAPKPEHGWYQHQEFALETLLVTDKSEERSKVAFMSKYKKRLQEAFETMLVEHRETHAKQSGAETTSAPAKPPVPQFRVEPLATVYVRHARSYVFLENALDTVLGPDALDKAYAVGEKGTEADTLRARIHRARDLFYGVYIASSQDLGMPAKLDAKGDPAAETWSRLALAAEDWLSGLASDPGAASDVRVMIPIAPLDGGKARYWAVIGVRTTLAGYSFLTGTDTSPPTNADQTARVALPTEQFLEVTSSATPLARDEFRALCDQNATADAIQKALEAR